MGKYRRLLLLTCIWLLLCGLTNFLYASNTSDIELTPEEQIWLDAHPKIVVGGETDWAPFDFVDETGQYAGVANDYLKAIGEKLGIEVQIVSFSPIAFR